MLKDENWRVEGGMKHLIPRWSMKFAKGNDYCPTPAISVINSKILF
jgi:hypothetical protein